MRKYRYFTLLVVIVLVLSFLGIPAMAVQEPAGYILNTDTGTLQEYYISPAECFPAIDVGALSCVTETKAAYATPRAFIRSFYSYTPEAYSYDYDNELFKIGMVRVDNSKNLISDATLAFTVEQSGSCSTTVTVGTTIGGEINAIYTKASIEFSGEVASEVYWEKGTRVETQSSVPPGQIGKVTAYVVGLYSGGTAIYSVENPATNTMTYEYVGIGAIIPTNNNWNLVVEIPCS